jgi:HEAT repeat protein
MRTIVFLAAAAVAIAQQPRLANARFETRPVTAGLEPEFQALVSAAAGPEWIGYAIRAVPGEHQMCCYSSFEDGSGARCCRGCALEGVHGKAVGAGAPGPVQLEASGAIFVLFRIDQKAVDRIRTFSAECELDGGGLPFHWLTGVRADESVKLLTGLALQPDTEHRNRRSEPAISAIALHGDPAADQALERFIAPSQPEYLREKAVFWLGSARGRRGYELLRKLITEDASDRIREKAVFGLNVSKEPEAVNTMIEIARNDRGSHVRGQALFWLGQKAGKKAIAAISEAIDRDPETEVKKKAVFALQQLPADEGVPMLIQVARSHKNPAVRKQAIFWLGQSRDARALRFFEEILLR